MAAEKLEEKIAYNALNLALESSHRQLKNLKEASGSWKNAWENYSRLHPTEIDPTIEFKKLEDRKICLVLFEEDEFPKLLKEIPWPPHGLYILGRKEIPTETLGIVGTRKATLAGKETARLFSKQMAEAGFAIVSGLALGIDTESHRGALEANRPTFAVLATGLDSFYPRINSTLAKMIAEKNGALLSEYPLGSPALPHRFLERNRIISGLSRSLLIIEAPESSGSLATARFALDQNRDIFVIPGPISHPNFKGSNELIRQGAALVTSSEEIIEQLNPALLIAAKPNPTDIVNKVSSDEEKAILGILMKAGKPVNIDKIMELTNLNAKITNQVLSFLIIKNLAKETENGYTL